MLTTSQNHTLLGIKPALAPDFSVPRQKVNGQVGDK